MNGSSGPAEVIVPLSGTTTGPYVLNRPLYYPHVITSTLTASTVNSIYTHNFSSSTPAPAPGAATLSRSRKPSPTTPVSPPCPAPGSTRSPAWLI